MKISNDPSVHRDREKQLIAHVEKLLEDERLRLDTTRGRRPITTLIRHVQKADKALDVKRLMTELDKPDRELQAKMPTGESLEVTLSQKSMWFFKKQLGKLQVICMSPTRDLIAGNDPGPMSGSAVNKLLADLTTQAGAQNTPSTVVLLSTSGFTRESHELAERRANRTLILVEPNDVGGWTVTGPAETKALTDLFDPEQDDAKRQRVRAFLQESRLDLLTGGMAADTIVAKTQIPQQIVEAELKSFAKDNPGLAAKRIGGQFLLYRESSGFSGDLAGADMPFWDKFKGMLNRVEPRDKKLARFAAEKAGLMQQRSAAYDEIGAVEEKEAALTATFEKATALSQQRIATEIAQLRKQIARRQQILATIDKKINIVETGIHNLEMEQQVSPEKLKDLADVAQSSNHVDEGMATLDQLNEEADDLSVVDTEIPAGVQDVLAELRAKSAAQKVEARAVEEKKASVSDAGTDRATERTSRAEAKPNTSEKRRSEAEPG